MTDQAGIIGQQIGDHIVEQVLGRGAAGAVYQAQHARLERPAALRVLDAAISSAPGFANAFAPQMRAAAGLRHPHIAEIYDVGIERGYAYIIEELLTGGSLRDLLLTARNGTPTPLAATVELLRQAAEGVGYAHGRGVVHGDLHPANLLRSARGAPKVSGFGIERLVAAGGREAGRPAYLAPEQLTGSAPTPRSDVYSLGVMLYETLTGYLPFAVSNRAEAAEKHARSQPTPPKMVRPQLPDALAAVALRCLAKRPEDRYADANELATALGDGLRGVGADVVLPRGAPATVAQPAIQPTQPPPSPPPSPQQQPTVVMPVIEQPTVVAGPRVDLLDAVGTVARTVALGAAGLQLGRGSENSLSISDDQLSREHLRINWDGQRATVTDLGSTNGTLIDGTRLQPGQPVPWRPNQELQAGRTRLRLILPPPPASTAATQAATVADPLLAQMLGGAAAASAATTANPALPPRVGPTGRGPQLNIELEQEQLTIEPGQPALLGVIVRNNGTNPVAVTLSVEGAPGGWVRGGAAAITIPPGSEANTTLTVLAPRDGAVAAGDYPVIVRARAAANQAESVTARGRWSLLPFIATSIALRPRSAEGPGEAEVIATVTNEGNATVGYLIEAEDPRGELAYDIHPDELTLDPGESAQVSVMVQGNRSWFGSAATYPFEVRALARGVPPVAAPGRFVNRAVMPLWALLAFLTLLGILGLAAAYYLRILPSNVTPQPTTIVLTPSPSATLQPTSSPTATVTPTTEPGAPAVARFQIEPNLGAPGQRVIVRWQVTGADRVTIEQFGDVPAEGEREYMLDQTVDFRLVATGGGKETVRIERVFVATPTPTTAPTPTATVPPTATVAPTAVPPTDVPATAVPATAVPATAVPATAVPPTGAPTPAPVTGAATASTNLPGLLGVAPTASWTLDGAPLTFGAPQDANRAAGGYAEVATQVALEDGQTAERLLRIAPRNQTGSVVEVRFPATVVQSGQRLRGSLAWTQRPAGSTATPAARIEIRFGNTPLLDVTKASDGRALPIDIDLGALAGRDGVVSVRVTATDPAAAVGVCLTELAVR